MKVTFEKAWRYADPADPGTVLMYGPGEVDIPERHAWRAVSLGHAALPDKRDNNPAPQRKVESVELTGVSHNTNDSEPIRKRRGRPSKKAPANG